MSMKKDETPLEGLDINEVDCWREAREWVALVYALTGREGFKKDILLQEIIRRHAVGLMSKISDGYHRRTKDVFLQRLEESKGILGETISELHVAFDQDCVTRDELNDVLSKAYTVGIRLNSFIKKVKRPGAN